MVLLFAGVVLLSVGCCLESHGGDDDLPTPSSIKLPMASVSVKSDEQQVVDVLPADTLWVIESTRELIVLASPPGLVGIESDVGPWKIMAKFADGTGKIELRTYTAPYLYFIQAAAKGEAEILMIPSGVTTESDIVRQQLTVMGPRPPPDPVDPDDPIDPEDPVDPPEPVESFRVIFVKESGATLSLEQTAIPGAKVIRDYLNSTTTKEDGLPGWREYDPQMNTTNEQTTMAELWSAVKGSIETTPALVVEVNGHATVMPFPANVDEAVATLKKYGGE